MTFNIRGLLRAQAFDHEVEAIELIETHISWVVLTGAYAYKIKKAVNFGFLDFSELSARKHYCEEELRLNRRLAPELYENVVAIHGPADRPAIQGEGDIIEYAVRMRQFPQSAQMDNKLHDGQLTIEHIEALADRVASFHADIEIASPGSHYGTPDAALQPALENIRQIRACKQHRATRNLERLEQWILRKCEHLKPRFESRRAAGFIRECHGDLHLRNLLWLHQQPQAFDCIEFNPDLRWIDVISDIAFLCMDLHDREQDALANCFLNRYLERTGDYEGVSLLPYYLCYRALVRAKVDALRLEQISDVAERQQVLAEFDSYMKLASRYTQHTAPELVLMRGVSASGKSTVSQQLVERAGMIRLRSDVERKRLHGLDATTDASAGNAEGIYTPAATRKTYQRLADLAYEILDAGYSVIVDATAQTYEQRRLFKLIANKLNSGYFILELSAPVSVLRERIQQRPREASDADLAVLEQQLASWQPLQADEQNYAMTLYTHQAYDVSDLVSTVTSQAGKL